MPMVHHEMFSVPTLHMMAIGNGTLRCRAPWLFTQVTCRRWQYNCDNIYKNKIIMKGWTSISKVLPNLGVLDFDTPAQIGGSCTVHAVVACIRGILRLQDDFTEPSIQDAISCCKSNGDVMNGWSIPEVLTYVYELGLAVAADYPLGVLGGDHEICIRCHPRPDEDIIPRIRINSFKTSPVHSVKQLRTLLCKHPIVVTLYVGEDFGGETSQPVLDDDELFVNARAKADLNKRIYGHAVVLIKPGKIKKRGYWIAKNSYGSQWGDRGYIKISQDCTPFFGMVGYPTGVTVTPLEEVVD